MKLYHLKCNPFMVPTLSLDKNGVCPVCLKQVKSKTEMEYLNKNIIEEDLERAQLEYLKPKPTENGTT